ncbi:hypothetical protein HMPREF0972_02153 [Actinomyces sp. oral taxon 848 str. F0332]|nr:hypothetical protein HMPREF0972_02153 [Actinomyces sp. oral taxon 848 str. F0332]
MDTRKPSFRPGFPYLPILGGQPAISSFHFGGKANAMQLRSPVKNAFYYVTDNLIA